MASLPLTEHGTDGHSRHSDVIRFWAFLDSGCWTWFNRLWKRAKPLLRDTGDFNVKTMCDKIASQEEIIFRGYVTVF